MLESEKDLVAKMLRAVLQANKNGVPLVRLQGEYKSLTGETIPFKEMGFHTLEAYLKAVPAVVKIDMNRAGEVVCHAVVCKETARIAELVARQRSSKRKSGGQVNCQMRLKYSAPVTHVGKPKATLRKPGFPSPQDRVIRKPVPSTAKVTGNIWGGGPPPDPHFPPPGAPLYNAGVSREVLPPRQPSITNRPERKVTLPPRFQKEGNSYLLPTPTVDSNANDTQSGKPPLLGSFYHNLVSVQNNLRELFSKYSNGIWISKLPLLYKETFKQDLGEDVLKQVAAWTHICTAQKLMNSGQTEVILYPPIRKQTTPKTSPHRSSEPIKQNISPVHSKPSTTPTQTPGTIPDAELKQKVSEILVHYPNGLWSRALPKVFEDTYRKKFPDEVLQNLSTLSDICTVDIISENPYKAILYAKTTVSEEQNMNLLLNMNVSQAIPKINQAENPSDTEDFDADLKPPALVFPSEASPSVLVVELNDTNEVVIRYIGQDYSVAQERMEDEMKEFYSKSSSHVKASSLRVGQLVAVKVEEDAWLRAEVSTTDDNKIKVYYVDHGFSDLVEVIKVCRLAKQFYTLPFQATQCRLAGLEAFSKDPILVKAVESKACGKILAVEILQKNEIPLVVLYDTSGDDDININASCLRELCDHSLSLQLKINSSYSNVIVTNVCSDGTLFCQVPSKGLAKLFETLQEIQSDFSSKHVTSDLFVNLPFCGKLCLFQCKGKWARVEITSVHSSRALDVQFLDSGAIASVKVSELREIPSQFLRDIISIPPQALKCCLADLPLNIGTWTPDAVLWLRNTVLNCSDCSIKVVKMDETKNMVHVYLFSSNNCLDPEKSINRLITNEELWKHQKDVFISVNPGLPSVVNCKGDATSNMPGPRKEQTHITKKHIEEQNNAAPCSEMPPPLPLPKPGEHIDVFVSVACHPGHFVFQPWHEVHKLEVVMEEMLLHYSTTEEKPVALEKTKIYAAKIDNKWYRVLLKGILTNGLVSVYQLDYGRHELVNCRKVQPLLQKFRQLPFQAVTSQLAGIKCEQWSEEASIVFRNHVEKKPLVALIQAVYESTNPWDRKVVVYIVDTSMPDTDVWVHDLMSEYLDELSRSE